MYGFNLGQIEGLDSSVQTLTLTIANQSETNTYTLNKASENPLVWSDSLDFESTTVYIMLTGGVAGLYIVAFTESDVDQTYNIQIKSETIEASFRSATEQVINQTTLKTKVFYVDDSELQDLVLGINHLPLYSDRNLTEQARSYEVYEYDAYIIHSVDSNGYTAGTYIPYYTFSNGSNFITGWGRASTSTSEPYQPFVVYGEIID